MNRKNFLKSMTFGAISGSVLLAACGGDAPKTESTTAPAAAPEAPAAAETPAVDCNDLSTVSAEDLKAREAVGYVNASTDPEKNCANCRFMKPNSEPNGCNGCQLFKGPVNPEGNCKSWFKKDA